MSLMSLICLMSAELPLPSPREDALLLGFAPDRRPVSQIVTGVKGDTSGTRRIREGDWHVEVFLGPGVSEADASLIVRAIRGNQLANGQAPLASGPGAGTVPELPEIDPSRIGSIEVVSPHTEPPSYENRTWEDFSSGSLYMVVVREGKVELRRIGFWIA